MYYFFYLFAQPLHEFKSLFAIHFIIAITYGKVVPIGIEFVVNIIA